MHRDRFGVEPICETLDVSASAYHQRATGERSARGVEDERLTGRIREVHEANYECYGYRRLHAQLVREGEQAGRDQIARLMGAAGIQGAKRRGILSPSPMPATARKRREAGAGAAGCDCRADALLLWASASVRVDFAQHASSPAGLSPLPSVRIPAEGREVEADDEHQTQRRSAQTGRTLDLCGAARVPTATPAETCARWFLRGPQGWVYSAVSTPTALPPVALKPPGRWPLHRSRPAGHHRGAGGRPVAVFSRP